MKNAFLYLILITGLIGPWLFDSCTNTGKVEPTSPPIAPIDTAAIQAADSISRNWWCASIKAPDEAARAISVLGKAWPAGSVLKVKFIGGTAAQRSWPIQALKDISAIANLKFEYVTTWNADCRISFDASQGAYSYIGTDSKNVPQSAVTCNIGWTGLDVATHELMHFLSFGHEQSSPKGGICWDKPVVYAALAAPPNGWSKAMVDANVFYQYAANQVDATEFDPLSIMEYQIPASWTCSKVGIPGGKVMTEKDKFMLAKIYPGLVAPPPPPPPGTVTISQATRDKIAALTALSKSNAAKADSVFRKETGL